MAKFLVFFNNYIYYNSSNCVCFYAKCVIFDNYGKEAISQSGGLFWLVVMIGGVLPNILRLAVLS
ncbi:hypothetical protein B0189_07510 [Moraxella cuniculi]|nr:hypothetical protein B0189_07510 [Moraxella cuniculi]